MGDLYRVIVVRETDANADVGVTETIVELAAPREMLAQFAPQAVAAALGTTAQDAALVTRVDPPRMAMEGPAETDGNYGPGEPRVRKRRTKAEMEAARAAEGEPLALAEVMPTSKAPTVTTTFESAKPIPVETPTSGSAYRPFG